MTFFNADKAIPKSSEVLLIPSFVDQKGLICAKRRKGKSQLDFNAKDTTLLHWKYHVVQFFLRNDHKENNREWTEHVRNIDQQRL